MKQNEHGARYLTGESQTRRKEFAPFRDLPTYVFVDASNISNACVGFGMNLDFVRFKWYLERNYPLLVKTFYYEGGVKNDLNKLKYFSKLTRHGYIVRSLQRKTYIQPSVFKDFTCENCGAENRVKVLDEHEELKSNVDVYLATDFLKTAFTVGMPAHLMIVSCDGDYCEPIVEALDLPEIRVSVMAVPKRGFGQNYLSTRLQELKERFPRSYYLTNILGLEESVKSKRKPFEKIAQETPLD